MHYKPSSLVSKLLLLLGNRGVRFRDRRRVEAWKVRDGVRVKDTILFYFFSSIAIFLWSQIDKNVTTATKWLYQNVMNPMKERRKSLELLKGKL